MKRPIAVITGLMLLSGWTTSAHAQNGDAQTRASACKAQFEKQLGYEERVYRSVIFGSPTIERFEPGSVLYDKEGHTWLKISDDAWQSPDLPNETFTDSIMDDERDIEARFGILETRKALSSELIPPALQAMRALQCRLRAVCMTVAESREGEKGETVLVQPPGCIEFEQDVFPGCIDVDSALMEGSSCDTTSDMIVARESRMLEMIFAYDAAYRSLLQFAGIFEGFLTDFRFPLLQPLWQMVRAVGQLDGIPCFLAECSE